MEIRPHTICSVFMKMLNCQIVPCGLNGAEIRGLKQVPDIERAHVFALKNKVL